MRERELQIKGLGFVIDVDGSKAVVVEDESGKSED